MYRGRGLKEIGMIEGHVDLDLSVNYLDSVILWPKLEYINLSGNKLTQVPDLSLLCSLLHINLAYNEIEKVDVHVPSSLRSMDLCYNLITAVPEFPNVRVYKIGNPAMLSATPNFIFGIYLNCLSQVKEDALLSMETLSQCTEQKSTLDSTVYFESKFEKQATVSVDFAKSLSLIKVVCYKHQKPEPKKKKQPLQESEKTLLFETFLDCSSLLINDRIISFKQQTQYGVLEATVYLDSFEPIKRKK